MEESQVRSPEKRHIVGNRDFYTSRAKMAQEMWYGPFAPQEPFPVMESSYHTNMQGFLAVKLQIVMRRIAR